MSEWQAKRFWKSADIAECDGGFTVLLDGRPIKTPAKSPFFVPTATLAHAVAAEWDAQEGKIDPGVMPMTRTANAAIDKVMPQHAEVAAMLAEYGGTDLVCYRASDPDKLVARQVAAWDPLLAWSADVLSAPLRLVSGVMFEPQPQDSLTALHDRVKAMDSFSLSAFHDLVSLPGSLIIGFATAYGLKSPETLWDLSRIDEKWQEEQWGKDDEAVEMAAVKRTAFLHAHNFWTLIQ